MYYNIKHLKTHNGSVFLTAIITSMLLLTLKTLITSEKINTTCTLYVLYTLNTHTCTFVLVWHFIMYNEWKWNNSASALSITHMLLIGHTPGKLHLRNLCRFRQNCEIREHFALQTFQLYNYCMYYVHVHVHVAIIYGSVCTL